MASLRNWFLGLVGRGHRSEEGATRTRGPAIHVIVLDGTMSSLEEGQETNAGLLFKLLREVGRTTNLTVYYEAGIQWQDWSGTYGVLAGKGLNRQIERAYGVLSSRYRPDDRIFLIGYSRGAYAVRSLAGVIGAVGLVKSDQATTRNIRQAYRHYRSGRQSEFSKRFSELYCHNGVEIAAVAVWDTVKALGLRLPIVWRWMGSRHDFHDHKLGAFVRHGFHALGIDETREAFAPVMWEGGMRDDGTVEQVWFRGTHGDVGGQLGGADESRPLANVSLRWMLDRLDACDLPLPSGWRERFPCDPKAPSIGTWRGWSKLFLSRRRRIVGRDASESLHPTATGHKRAQGLPIWSAPDSGG